MNTIASSEVPDVKHKSTFEEALSKLDLEATITLLTVLSQRALFLLSIKELEAAKIVKPKNILHQ